MNNDDEIRFWNRRGGVQWSTNQSHYDTLFTEVSDHLLARAHVQLGETVLDIGCGNADTTASVAQAVGPNGRVIGLDVSRPLLDAARDRLHALGLQQVELIESDAQSANLGIAADVIFSRFGVMFFSDPRAAFVNLRRHAVTSGRLAFAAWGEQADNPWFSWAFDAAVAELGPVPARDPRKAGPTAFGDPDYVTRTLALAGWQDVEVHTERLALHIDGDAKHTAQLAAELGPVARVYKVHTPTDAARARIVARLIPLFKDVASTEGTRVPACIHIVTARNGHRTHR